MGSWGKQVQRGVSIPAVVRSVSLETSPARESWLHLVLLLGFSLLRLGRMIGGTYLLPLLWGLDAGIYEDSKFGAWPLVSAQYIQD